MGISIEELRETLTINRNDLLNNESLVNELIVDDLMAGLGYNRKRDTSVKRTYTGVVDWEVINISTETNKKIKVAVKVYGLSTEGLQELTPEIISYCLDKRFSIIIVTNGELIDILRLNKEKLEYVKVLTIDINSDLNDEQNSILDAISKNKFNMELIDDFIKSTGITYEQILDVLINNINIIENGVSDILNVTVEDIKEHCEKIIDALQNKVDNTSTADLENTVDTSEQLNSANESINELTSKVESLEQQLSEKDNTISELQQQIENSNNQPQVDTEAIDTLQNEITELKQQLIEKNSTIVELEQQIENTPIQTEIDTDTVENLNNEIGELKQKLIEKDNLLAETNNSLAELKQQLDNQPVVEDNSSAILSLEQEISLLKQQLEEKDNLLDSKDDKIKEQENQLASKDALIDEKDNQISELQAANEIGATYSSSDESSEVDKDLLDQYVAQIRDLTSQLGNKNEEVDKLKAQIEDQKKELYNLQDVDKKKALEMLELIEDSPDNERNYVAVINTELLQFNKIYTFVGQVLGKLYELKNFEASQYIFNGDLFRLVQPAERNDLIMNNKAYDLDLGNSSEDEILNKLRILFSHFNDIAFACKKVGTLTESALQADKVIKPDKFAGLTGPDEVIDGNNDDGAENYQFNQNLDTQNQGDWGNTGIENQGFNNFDNNQFNADASMNNFNNNDFGYADAQYNYGPESMLLVQNLTNIDSLVWTQENVQFNNIKYVGGQDVTFAINLGTQDINYDTLLCKCIDAILAIEAYNGNASIITDLKQKDFTFTNNAIKLYTDEYKNYPRINGTKYAIVNVSSVQQVATILVDICNALNINTDAKYIYLEAITDSKLIIDGYSINEDSVQLLETDYFEANENDSKTNAIIRGDLFNKILVTRNSLTAHKDIILNTTRVKTKYMDLVIQSLDDVPTVIEKILEKGLNDNVQINYAAIGNVVGERYRIVSPRENEVSPNHTNFIVGGTTIYCSNVEQWQIPHTLVKLHTTIVNDTAIALQTQINANAINFYGSEFETTEPSLSLAIRSFVDYIVSCVKQK